MSVPNFCLNDSLNETKGNHNEAIAAILKTAVPWELFKSGQSAEPQAMGEIKQFMLELPDEVIDVLHDSVAPIDEDGIVLCSLNKLQPGMVLAKYVIISDGVRLLRQGRRLDESTIDRLGRHFADQPVRIAVTLD
ncbi:MAG: hypothetical protein AAF664_01730 [Planctomycetota bacterium]